MFLAKFESENCFVLGGFLFSSEYKQGYQSYKESLVSTRGKPWLKFKLELNYEKQWILRAQRTCLGYALFSFRICSLYAKKKKTPYDLIYWKPCLQIYPVTREKSRQDDIHAQVTISSRFLLCVCFISAFISLTFDTVTVPNFPDALQTNSTGKVIVEKATVFPMSLWKSCRAHVNSIVFRLNFSHDKFRQVTFI